MRPLDLALASLGLASLGIILVVPGWLLAVVTGSSQRGSFALDRSKASVGRACVCILTGGLTLGLSITGGLIAGLWWSGTAVFSHLSPGRLALASVVVGPLPLLLSALSVLLARILGGSVDARGANVPTLRGVNLNGLIYTLFMSYWGMFITVGLSVLGLMASGVWALIRLF